MLDDNKENTKERVSRALFAASVGVERAAALSRRLLAFSRMEPLNALSIDVQNTLTWIIDLLRSSIGATVNLETEFDTRGWQVEADPAQLETAILNLAVNARDTVPEGGRVRITASAVVLDADYAATRADVRPGPHVVIEVSDSGNGMTKDVLEHAFEPFFTTKPRGIGTGLGLSQVYSFVKQSLGHVSMSSERGKGTSIHIYLPRSRVVERPEDPSNGVLPR